MKKILLVPDSFKGTLSSIEICAIMEQAIKSYFPGADIIKIPVADGGEGSVDAFLAALGGFKKNLAVQGPFTEPVESFFGILKDRTAVIEMAACAGLPLAGGKKNPSLATTYGVGELIKAALDEGCRKIILCIGGSATNDGGCGAAAALGVKFFCAEGEFVPTGGSLHKIRRIDKSHTDSRLKEAQLVTMCDIDNPLFGENGAAFIFAPQKGADPQMVKFLDEGLRHLAEIVKRDFSADAAEIPGAGAAGGMGYGMKVFFGSQLKMGIQTVLDTVGFDALVKDADLVFTGEGKIDSQSLRGKVVYGVAGRCRKANVPLAAVVGAAEDGIDAIFKEGLTSIFCINHNARHFADPSACAKANLAFTMRNIMRFLKSARI